jgi:uncharacterized LabA/DUF88 family protein
MEGSSATEEREMKKIAIFVDGSNFGAALKQVPFRVDYKKMREYFATFGELIGSFYFTALPPAGQASPIRQLTDSLQYSGWTLVTKETKTHFGKTKGNMDIDLVIKAVRLLDYEAVTDLILLSGDGDFKPMVEYLQENGVRVTVISYYSRDGNNMMADELRRCVHEFINLPDLREHLELTKVERRMNFLEGR